MKCWQMSQLRLVTSTGAAEDTFKNVLYEINRLGFDFCSFMMKAAVPLAAPKVLWCSNYPITWIRRYEGSGYLRRDPTIAHAIVSDEPLLWTDQLFSDCPEMRAEARSFGLVHGWAQPRRDAHGILSLLSCARTEPVITNEELSVKIERLQWLSYLCHHGMLKHWGAGLRCHPETALSDREVEVLRWSSDGKTSLDMAQIMNLSEATVNFHMRNACLKLGAGNKTAAAVRAALMGLLV